MLAYTCNTSSGEVETGRLRVQDHPEHSTAGSSWEQANPEYKRSRSKGNTRSFQVTWKVEICC